MGLRSTAENWVVSYQINNELAANYWGNMRWQWNINKWNKVHYPILIYALAWQCMFAHIQFVTGPVLALGVTWLLGTSWQRNLGGLDGHGCRPCLLLLWRCLSTAARRVQDFTHSTYTVRYLSFLIFIQDVTFLASSFTKIYINETSPYNNLCC